MGSYLYDDYEAKMKVTNDIINDWNFYTKLRSNFVSPQKIFRFVEIIFITNKSAPYHIKFLQIFYNNINILERDEYFHIINELYQDLSNNLTFHESYNNFNKKLCDIKAKNPDRSIFNFSLVKPRKTALEHFFLYVNYHRYKFEQIKKQINIAIKEIYEYPQKVETDEKIKKLEYDVRPQISQTYIGELNDDKKEGKGILITKNKSSGVILETYMGEFKNDKKNGLGIVKREKEQIEGNFLDDKLNGKIGIYTDSNLEIIEYENDKINGRKISYEKNGNIFTTSFINGKTSKIFSMYFKESGLFFTGKKNENDTYEGIIYEKNEGNVEVGIFSSDFKLIGEGYKYINHSGIYCSFNNGKIIPSLSYQSLNSGILIKSYINEKIEVHGENSLVLNYTQGNAKEDLFIGTYVNDERIGYGEYYWGDGDYEKKINPVGWGVRYFADKNAYLEGSMQENGFPSGKGKLTFEGDVYNGVYILTNTRCLFVSDNRKAYGVTIVNTPRFNEATATQYKTEVNN